MAARNAMEIFSLLDKSNCRKCGEKTCLAFAGAVFTGRKNIDACPALTPEQQRSLCGDSGGTDSSINEEGLKLLQAELARLDLAEAAERAGGRVAGDILHVRILGKDFGVDRQGRFYTDIHVNPWITGPLLIYLLKGAGHAPRGRWISLREMRGGMERYALFQKRTEDDLRKIADAYPDFFDDIIKMFDAREVEQQFASDISVVLHPLPKVPVMICYWKAEDGIGSNLHLFFDDTVDDNIGIDGVYSLAAGLAVMFSKLALQHGFVADMD